MALRPELKFKLRGFTYLLFGALLSLSGWFGWLDALIFPPSVPLTQARTGSLHTSLILIGLCLMAASYFEFRNARREP